MPKIDYLTDKLSNGDNDIFRGFYGDNPGVLTGHYKDYQEIIHNFKSSFKKDDIELFSSPGRTEIGGNHTDHNHGRVLAGSVSLDNIAVASKNFTNLITIESEGYPDIQVDCSDLEPKEDEKYTSAALVRGVVAGLKNAGYKYGGFDAIVKGRVPKGSGLSSSASFEVLAGTILSTLYNDNKIDSLQIALIGQYAENHYFGKPCGLMDQTACATGGLITIDFKNPADPTVKRIGFDFSESGYILVITNTGGDHVDLNDEYASLPAEMRSVAGQLGAEYLRETSVDDVLKSVPVLRAQTGDRAILRAFHFHSENQRVLKQVEALEAGDFGRFLQLLTDSGYSSFMYNQNIHSPESIREQSVALGLAVSELLLKEKGGWRVHGGGFAGTIQAFVPKGMLNDYVRVMESIFGEGACYNLFIRNSGAVNLKFS